MSAPSPPPLPRGMPKGLKITLWVIGIWAALILIGKVSSTSSSNSPSSSSTVTTTAAEDGAALAARDEARRRADPTQCLVLQSPKTVAEEYSVSITGAIKNTCGHTFRYVQITWKLLDGSGAVVGTALANQSNLDNGETWKFKAHAFTEFAKYRLDKITAF